MKAKQILLLLLALGLFCSCGVSEGSESPYTAEDTKQWVPETVLASAGLPGLPAPAQTDNLNYSADGIMWVFFFSETGDTALMESYVPQVFTYFQNNYEGKFGKSEAKGTMTSGDTIYTIFKITPVTACTDLYSTNPDPRYTFTFRTKEKENGSSFYPDDSVFSLDVRVEDGLLKVFLSDENQQGKTTKYS
jgi:hypothetical protein